MKEDLLGLIARYGGRLFDISLGVWSLFNTLGYEAAP